MALGFNDWFTENIGMDYGIKPVFYNTSSFRIGTPYVAALTISPSNLYQATFNALFPSQTSFEFQSSHFGNEYFYNDYGFAYDEGKASLYLPFHLLRHPLNIRFQGDGKRIASKYV